MGPRSKLYEVSFVVVPFPLAGRSPFSPGFYPINRGVALLSGSDRDMDVSVNPLCYLFRSLWDEV
jgi:hypothetical protein